jgi:nucleoid DNA-binding protein
MTKHRIMPVHDLVNKIATDTDLPCAVVRKVMDSLSGEIGYLLSLGHRVRVPGIGTFDTRRLDPRQGIGPDGRHYMVMARHKVTYRAANSLASAIDQARSKTDAE